MDENRGVHDSPKPELDSGHQSYTPKRSILLGTRSLYIATGCCKPVHHLITPALSDAWLPKRCICRDVMNKSAAINSDYHQKLMQGLNMTSLQCGCIIARISKVQSFWGVMISFFGDPYTGGPWSYRPRTTKVKHPEQKLCERWHLRLNEGILWVASE